VLRRAHIRFYLPLLFYTLDWLVFFILIPRSWTPMEMQNSAAQTDSIARPVATDARFKTGAFLALLAWAIICCSLVHSIFHYKTSTSAPSTSRRAPTPTPLKLLLTIILMGLHIAYTAVASWSWSLSPYNISASLGWLYGLGYTPALLILIIFNLYGYIDENEDKLLIAQRARRGESELRLLRARKPGWWSRSNSRTQRREGQDVEVRDGNLLIVKGGVVDDEDASGYWWWRRRKEEEAEAETEASRRRNRTMGTSSSSAGSSSRYILGSSMLTPEDSDHVPRWKQKYTDEGDGGSERTASSLRSGVSDARPQIVRSMLDV
jgi:Protein of unknown function (DUF2434)